jgi:hypothetical protein
MVRVEFEEVKHPLQPIGIDGGEITKFQGAQVDLHGYLGVEDKFNLVNMLLHPEFLRLFFAYRHAMDHHYNGNKTSHLRALKWLSALFDPEDFELSALWEHEIPSTLDTLKAKYPADDDNATRDQYLGSLLIIADRTLQSLSGSLKAQGPTMPTAADEEAYDDLETDFNIKVEGIRRNAWDGTLPTGLELSCMERYGETPFERYNRIWHCFVYLDNSRSPTKKKQLFSTPTGNKANVSPAWWTKQKGKKCLGGSKQELGNMMEPLSGASYTAFEVACSIIFERDRDLCEHLSDIREFDDYELKDSDNIIPPTYLRNMNQWRAYISRRFDFKTAVISLRDIEMELLDESGEPTLQRTEIHGEKVSLDVKEIRALFERHEPSKAIFYCTLNPDVAPDEVPLIMPPGMEPYLRKDHGTFRATAPVEYNPLPLLSGKSVEQDESDEEDHLQNEGVGPLPSGSRATERSIQPEPTDEQTSSDMREPATNAAPETAERSIQPEPTDEQTSSDMQEPTINVTPETAQRSIQPELTDGPTSPDTQEPLQTITNTAPETAERFIQPGLTDGPTSSEMQEQPQENMDTALDTTDHSAEPIPPGGPTPEMQDQSQTVLETTDLATYTWKNVPSSTPAIASSGTDLPIRPLASSGPVAVLGFAVEEARRIFRKAEEQGADPDLSISLDNRMMREWLYRTEDPDPDLQYRLRSRIGKPKSWQESVKRDMDKVNDAADARKRLTIRAWDNVMIKSRQEHANHKHAKPKPSKLEGLTQISTPYDEWQKDQLGPDGGQREKAVFLREEYDGLNVIDNQQARLEWINKAIGEAAPGYLSGQFGGDRSKSKPRFGTRDVKAATRHANIATLNRDIANADREAVEDDQDGVRHHSTTSVALYPLTHFKQRNFTANARIEEAALGSNSQVGPEVEACLKFLDMTSPEGEEGIHKGDLRLYSSDSLMPDVLMPLLASQITGMIHMLYRTCGQFPLSEKQRENLESNPIPEELQNYAGPVVGGGFLEDAPGMGKTATWLTFFNWWSQHADHKNAKGDPEYKPTMLLTPDGYVLKQWVLLINKFFPSINLIVAKPGEHWKWETAEHGNKTFNYVNAKQVKGRWPKRLQYIFDTKDPRAARTIIISSYSTMRARIVQTQKITDATLKLFENKSKPEGWCYNKTRKRYEQYHVIKFWQGKLAMTASDEGHITRNDQTQTHWLLRRLDAAIHWHLTATPIINSALVSSPALNHHATLLTFCAHRTLLQKRNCFGIMRTNASECTQTTSNF